MMCLILSALLIAACFTSSLFVVVPIYAVIGFYTFSAVVGLLLLWSLEEDEKKNLAAKLGRKKSPVVLSVFSFGLPMVLALFANLFPAFILMLVFAISSSTIDSMLISQSD